MSNRNRIFAFLVFLAVLFAPNSEAQMRKKKIFISGVFTPASLTGKKLWLKANDLTTMFQDAALTTPVTDGSAWNGWKDKSGNGNDFVTASTNAQGIYRANIKNSKGVGVFNGTATQFQTTGIAATAHTVWIVFASTNTTTSYGTVFAEAAGNHGFDIKGTSGVGYVLDLLNSSDHDSGNITFGNWSTFLGTLDGAGTGQGFLNGSSFYNSTEFASITYARIGGHTSEWFGGYIAEIVMIDHVASGTEISNMATYLTSEWGSTP